MITRQVVPIARFTRNVKGWRRRLEAPRVWGGPLQSITRDLAFVLSSLFPTVQLPHMHVLQKVPSFHYTVKIFFILFMFKNNFKVTGFYCQGLALKLVIPSAPPQTHTAYTRKRTKCHVWKGTGEGVRTLAKGGRKAEMKGICEMEWISTDFLGMP